MKYIYFITLLSVCLCFGLNGMAEIKMPTIFGDNMVLQQRSHAAIWGWASPQKRVVVKTSWNGKSYTVLADENGKWKLKVQTPDAGGPYTIKISDGKEKVLNNVLIGEVWLCSGQSNMEMPMRGFSLQPVRNSQDAIVRAKNKNIRVFTVQRNYDLSPLDDCTGIWEEASPESIARTSAVAYYFGRLLNQVEDVPVGLLITTWGGSSIKAWMSKENLAGFDIYPAKSKAEIKKPVHSPTVLYNAMLHPLIGYGIRGTIWYQGETDVAIPNLYIDLFKSMVREWRMQWGVGEFPFYYCQIAPYKHSKNQAFFREAQGKCMSIVPNTGMVVTMDADSPDCIHPDKKQEVGERLAYWALAETYGIKGFKYKSPTVKGMKVEGNVAIISFNDAPNGLIAKNGEVKGVYIAGKNKKWYKANVSFFENTMRVSAHDVFEPVAVRYAFDEYAPGEIFSTQGLPVSSFRTDDWTE
ncbi:sialate O-acetylesterase [Gabonia massiliensis]|uniref:sialate O-acetylesterase n=1 Tax=Gabonia massiliensis TaxID=1686296 RepID=UPI00093EA9D7|nr:sialate O-acetylesterase [Gabonia massiliensis]